MEGPRACKKEELSSTIDLIDRTFRIPRGCRPTMAEEFRLLLDERNLENGLCVVMEQKTAISV